MDEKMWVIVPALNEAESLQEMVPEILENLDDVSPDGHLLVVDDGSTDKTTEVVSDFSAKDARVPLVSLPTNQGESGRSWPWRWSNTLTHSRTVSAATRRPIC